MSRREKGSYALPMPWQKIIRAHKERIEAKEGARVGKIGSGNCGAAGIKFGCHRTICSRNAIAGGHFLQSPGGINADCQAALSEMDSRRNLSISVRGMTLLRMASEARSFPRFKSR